MHLLQGKNGPTSLYREANPFSMSWVPSFIPAGCIKLLKYRILFEMRTDTVPSFCNEWSDRMDWLPAALAGAGASRNTCLLTNQEGDNRGPVQSGPYLFTSLPNTAKIKSRWLKEFL